mmetsp:Transcript_20809/g.33989  ORF Transcript_20809/g.33989 Transcript_20809/m.33989 type:complete len:102 (+) Transcript_20809:604-909(+)
MQMIRSSAKKLSYDASKSLLDWNVPYFVRSVWRAMIFFNPGMFWSSVHFFCFFFIFDKKTDISLAIEVIQRMRDANRVLFKRPMHILLSTFKRNGNQYKVL